MKRNIHLLNYFLSIPFVVGMILYPAMKAEAKDSSGDSSSISYSQNVLPALLNQQAGTLNVNESEVRAGLLYDIENKRVVWQKNMQNAYPIASLTKMMVALLTVEDVRKGLFNWEDRVRWTRDEYRGRGKSRRRIRVEVNYSLRDVFKAAMIASNNECAEQMARFIGNGDLAATITRMNERARELKMQNTFYGNPTGLPASSWMNDNASTPVDQLMLTIEMLKYEEVLEIASMGYASIENGKASSVIKNHNKLTIEYSGEVDGLKTGYTRRAGFCLVATTAKCGHRLVGIVFGCRAPQIRNDIVRDMFNDYYGSIGLDRLGPNGNSLYSAPSASVKSGNGEYVTVKELVKKTHTVRSGETLSGISARYGCKVSDIRKWNSRTLRSNRILRGQSLTVYSKQTKKVFIEKPANGSEEEDDNSLVENTVVPVTPVAEKAPVQPNKATTAAVDKTKVAVKNTPKKQTESNYVYHTVAPGDTLTSIARKYEGTTVEQLKQMNQITDAKSLKPGMKIKVLVQD